VRPRNAQREDDPALPTFGPLANCHSHPCLQDNRVLYYCRQYFGCRKGSMMRRLVAMTLAVVCLSPSKHAFAGSVLDQTPAERTASLKQQVVRIPAGTVIEVKLQQKGSKKITGRLGSITREGFEVQTVMSGQVSTEKVEFADVKSVKEKHGMSRVIKVLIVAGIVVAVSAALTGILIAVGPPSN